MLDEFSCPAGQSSSGFLPRLKFKGLKAELTSNGVGYSCRQSPMDPNSTVHFVVTQLGVGPATSRS